MEDGSWHSTTLSTFSSGDAYLVDAPWAALGGNFLKPVTVRGNLRLLHIQGEVSSMSKWLLMAQTSSKRVLEVVLVAFLLVIASRYWVISEHVAYISLFAATALIALTRGFEGALSVRRFLPLIAFGLFTGWVVLSSTWSPSFHLSLGRAVTVGLVAAIGVAIGFALKPLIVAWGLILGVLFLVAHATFTDGLGWLGFLALGQEPGNFTNVSDMTYMLGVGIVSAFWIASRKRGFFLFFLPIVLLFAIIAAGIPVLTMYFASVAALFVGLMILSMRLSTSLLRRKLRVIYSAISLFIAVALWSFRTVLLGPLQEDPELATNLSGRTIIWDWYFEAFLWEPIIGVGWGNTYKWPLTQGNIFPTGQYFLAHNGFLDIGLVTGGVGVILIVATLVLLFLRGSSLALDPSKSLSYLFVPTIVTYIVVNDIMATSLPRFIGVFLVGTLVGLVVSEPAKSDTADAPEHAERKELLRRT